jgi:hypothetical protein
MLGEIPKKIAELSNKLEGIKTMENTVDRLLLDKPILDNLMSRLDRLTTGGNFQQFLLLLNWSAVFSISAFVLSLFALGVSFLTWRRTRAGGGIPEQGGAVAA